MLVVDNKQLDMEIMAHFAKMHGSSFVPFWLPPPRNVACGHGASLIHVDLVLVIGRIFVNHQSGRTQYSIATHSYPIWESPHPMYCLIKS